MYTIDVLEKSQISVLLNLGKDFLAEKTNFSRQEELSNLFFLYLKRIVQEPSTLK